MDFFMESIGSPELFVAVVGTLFIMGFLATFLYLKYNPDVLKKKSKVGR